MTHKTNGKYIIIDADDIKFVDFAHVEQSGPDTVRYSLDGKRMVLKYMNEQPDFVYLITGDSIGLPEYTHTEIREIITSSDWKVQKPYITSSKPGTFDGQRVCKGSEHKVLNDQARRNP
tara:strand:- start:9764 stop:10120 length:357 start_codon:yes stop_codon:yes gene_type:complete